MVAPLFVRWSLKEYGFRGTLTLIAGITLNNIFAVLLMQPVRWHMKRVEVLVTKGMWKKNIKIFVIQRVQPIRCYVTTSNNT